jgi:hypothetical protein
MISERVVVGAEAYGLGDCGIGQVIYYSLH